MEIGRFHVLIFSITELDPIDSIGWLLSITVGRIISLEGISTLNRAGPQLRFRLASTCLKIFPVIAILLQARCYASDDLEHGDTASSFQTQHHNGDLCPRRNGCDVLTGLCCDPRSPGHVIS